ncbi:hypothetical protein [Paraburkholderia sp. MM6662-R1]
MNQIFFGPQSGASTVLLQHRVDIAMQMHRTRHILRVPAKEAK